MLAGAAGGRQLGGVRSARRVFSAAGSGPSAPVFDFGRDTIGLLRGFDAEDVVGTARPSSTLDLRFPILRVQRGAGTWPFFVRSIHGAVFVDAGNAWDSSFRAADIRRSLGGELSIDVVMLYGLPLTIAGGAAGRTIRSPAATARPSSRVSATRSSQESPSFP